MSRILAFLVDVLGFISLGAFFLSPPILFYLNRRLKLRIPIVLVCLLSISLGWLLPAGHIIIAGVLHEKGIECSYSEGPGAVGMLGLGWIFSGFILLLWSPFLLLFHRGIKYEGVNRRKKANTQTEPFKDN